jgi:hypothetical protein
MIDQKLARLRSHRNNINRYQRLKKTTLTDLEREFIDRRLAAEQSAFEALIASTFPLTFDDVPPPPGPSTNWEAAYPTLGNNPLLAESRVSNQGHREARQVEATDHWQPSPLVGDFNPLWELAGGRPVGQPISSAQVRHGRQHPFSASGWVASSMASSE